MEKTIDIRFWRRGALVIAVIVQAPNKDDGSMIALAGCGYVLIGGGRARMTDDTLYTGWSGWEKGQPLIRLFDDEDAAKCYITEITALIKEYNARIRTGDEE